MCTGTATKGMPSLNISDDKKATIVAFFVIKSAVLFSDIFGIQKQTPQGCLFLYGGDEENRTPDPLLARQVLSQLSYTPITDYIIIHYRDFVKLFLFINFKT